MHQGSTCKKNLSSEQNQYNLLCLAENFIVGKMSGKKCQDYNINPFKAGVPFMGHRQTE